MEQKRVIIKIDTPIDKNAPRDAFITSNNIPIIIESNAIRLKVLLGDNLLIIMLYATITPMPHTLPK